MTAQRVTGVIWWRMGISHYQSLFRRARGGEPKVGFTRDYLQASGILPALQKMFEGREPPYQVTYRWGSGSYPNGRIFPAADYDQNGRVEVGQFLGGVPPKPWQIGDPVADPEITLPGDPEASIPGEARAQWRTRIQPLRPWLTMVQLDHSQDELHIRAYLEAPTPELEEASLRRVPVQLLELMTAPSRGAAGAAVTADWDLLFDPGDFRNPWRAGSASGSRTLPRQGVGAPPGVEQAPEPSLFGTGYKVAEEDVSSAQPEPFDVDPDERDRGTQAHNQTQNALAEIVRGRGLVPRSPSADPNFDLAWEEPDGRVIVAEVKSVTEKNSERQTRLGIGQVLRYRHLMSADGADVAAVLVLSAAPQDLRWVELCTEVGIGLIWQPDLEAMLDEWLG